MAHIDYIREMLARNEGKADGEMNAVKIGLGLQGGFVVSGELYKLVEKEGSEKIKAIAANMKACESNRYKRITDKQLYAVAVELIEKYKTARAVYSAAFNEVV